MVKQILTFSRMTESAYSPIALKTVVNESLKMLRSVIPSTIEIKQDLTVSGMVMSDPVQINQIMINLCTNAVHAMDETGGILEVNLVEVSIDDEAISHGLDIPAGPYVKLVIRDTGKGMPPEIKDRIFEPYFTTKELGRGTGLGLSVIHGIVKNHKGTVTCTSAPDAGTTFEVYLPRITSEQTQGEYAVEKPLPGGNERILFVDDEQTLANLTVEMLGSRGYDMTMPGMTGDRLARELIAIRHDIPVILCTGYNEHISEERAQHIGIREFIMKPLDIRTLSEITRKVLDKG